MELDLRRVRIVQDIASQRLEAYFGVGLLWSAPVEEPGCIGEATDFYTTTVIALLNAWTGMSNHAKFALLSVGNQLTTEISGGQTPILGRYPSKKH